MTITFDTLAYCKTLQEAGMPIQQAEAMAQAQAKAMSEMIAAKELATKGDIMELEHRLIKWVAGIAASQTAVILAIMALMHS